MGTSWSSQAVLALVAIIGAPGVAALIVALANRSKTKAETNQIVGADWSGFTDQLQEMNSSLHAENKDCAERVAALNTRLYALEQKVAEQAVEISRLRGLLVMNGIDPGTSG